MKRPPVTQRYGIDIAKEVKKRIESSPYSVLAIFLFGSCAQDTPSEESDIDIAILCEPFARSKVKEVVAFHQLIHDLDTRIELIILHPEDLKNRYLTIAQEIKRHGIAV